MIFLNLSFKKGISKGFSIVHLIVVIAVLAILVTMGLPRFAGHIREARAIGLMHDSRLIEEAAARYFSNYGRWPRIGEPLTRSQIPITLAHHSIIIDEAFWDGIDLVTTNPTHPNAIRLFRIDAAAIAPYVRINSDISNFVLRNPSGTVYVAEGTTTQTTTQTQTALPTITMSTNLNYAVFMQTPVALEAVPSDASRVTSIRFYANNQPIGEATGSPWTISWTGPNGIHSIHTVATLNTGETVTSNVVRIIINAISQTIIGTDADAHLGHFLAHDYYGNQMLLPEPFAGTGLTVRVGNEQYPDIYHAFLRFNLSPLNNKQVISARLRTSNSVFNNALSTDFNIARITTPWSDASTAPPLRDFTNQYISAFPNINPNLVNDWINGVTPNHGVEIWSSTFPKQIFNSRESGNNPPQLVVEHRDNILTTLTANITRTPSQGAITNETLVAFDHTTSQDPFGRPIVAAEWQINNEPITTTAPNRTFTIGNHTVRLRVQNSLGEWSAWREITINVLPAVSIVSPAAGSVISPPNVIGVGQNLPVRLEARVNTGGLPVFVRFTIRNTSGVSHIVGHTAVSATGPWFIDWNSWNGLHELTASVFVQGSSVPINQSAPITFRVDAIREAHLYSSADAEIRFTPAPATLINAHATSLSINTISTHATIRFEAAPHIAGIPRSATIISARLITSDAALNNATATDVSIRENYTSWGEWSSLPPQHRPSPDSSFPFVSPALISQWITEINSGITLVSNGPTYIFAAREHSRSRLLVRFR